MEAKKRFPYCGEEILAVAIKCKHCGSNLGSTVPSAPTPASPTRIRTPFKILLGMIVALIAVAFIFSPPKVVPVKTDEGGTSIPPELAMPARAVADVKATQAPTLPPLEAKLVQITSEAQEASRVVENDMQRGGIKNKRDKDICALMKSLAVQHWVGTVKTVDANSDGKGVLAIQIAEDVFVKTWNNALSDITDQTLIDPNTELFKVASSMQSGQSVNFSGRFFTGTEGDCIEESSLTLRGKLRQPEFIFKFSSVTPQ
jgi:hypothetical protein